MKNNIWATGAMLLALLMPTCSDGDSTDVGESPDTSDTDVDTNNDTDIVSYMTICDGGRLDPMTNLCWQDPPMHWYQDMGLGMNWYEAVGLFHEDHNPESLDYCGDLVHGGHSDWRLPDIDEVISLIRGCQEDTRTEDVSRSLCEMLPSGCVATDSCEERQTCDFCAENSGPGADGCYWDPILTGTCWVHWSASSNANDDDSAWSVFFNFGGASNRFKSAPARVRCVRGE